jgi:hypothetical protein
MMKNKTTNSRGLAAIALLCFASAAFGQTVPFEIVSPNSNNLGGVYTDPYNALVNGTPVEAFCDDFTDEVSAGQSWNALATNLSQFPSASPPVLTVYYKTGVVISQTQDYIAAAILASEGLQAYTSNPTTANEISFALWGVFDTTLLTNNDAGLSTADLTAAEGFLSGALKAAKAYSTGLAYEQATGNNVVIYSPTTGSNSTTLQTATNCINQAAGIHHRREHG